MAAQSLVDTLGNVLMWAYTLVEVTASWWHTTEGDLHCRGPMAVAPVTLRLSVFGAAPFDQCCGLVPLTPGHEEKASRSTSCTPSHTLLREHMQHDRRWRDELPAPA